MEEKKIIAVDFDGTLCRNCYPNIGEPNFKLLAILRNLKQQGCTIILWTCRCGERLKEAVAWCQQFQLHFDAVNENAKEVIEKFGTDSRKIFADVYIDDKACFPWEEENGSWEGTEYGKKA